MAKINKRSLNLSQRSLNRYQRKLALRHCEHTEIIASALKYDNTYYKHSLSGHTNNSRPTVCLTHSHSHDSGRTAPNNHNSRLIWANPATLCSNLMDEPETAHSPESSFVTLEIFQSVWKRALQFFSLLLTEKQKHEELPLQKVFWVLHTTFVRFKSQIAVLKPYFKKSVINKQGKMQALKCTIIKP